MNKTVKVQIKNVQISPVKARFVANLVRNLSVERALDVLQFLNKKSALHIRKALVTGVSNAKDILGVEASALRIKKLTIDEGLKRGGVRFESRGRATRLTKRRSHINLELESK